MLVKVTKPDKSLTKPDKSFLAFRLVLEDKENKTIGLGLRLGLRGY